MYRVELKVAISFFVLTGFFIVPNVPCGVESLKSFLDWHGIIFVPNVPCGVESHFTS